MIQVEIGILERQEVLGRLRINKAQHGFDVCKYRQYFSSDKRETALAQIFQVGEGHTDKIQEGKTSMSLKSKRKGNEDVYSVKSSLAVIWNVTP